MVGRLAWCVCYATPAVWHELFEWKTATMPKLLNMHRIKCKHVDVDSVVALIFVCQFAFHSQHTVTFYFFQIHSVVNFAWFSPRFFFHLFRLKKLFVKKLNFKISPVNDSHRTDTAVKRKSTHTYIVRIVTWNRNEAFSHINKFYAPTAMCIMIHEFLMGVNYISDFMLLKILLGAFALDNRIWNKSSFWWLLHDVLSEFILPFFSSDVLNGQSWCYAVFEHFGFPTVSILTPHS